MTAAAAALLQQGGNAFDAVVAGAFASAVAEPLLTSLGGGGFCLVRTAAGEEVVFDFFVDTPGRGLPQPLDPPPLVPVTVRFIAADQVFHTGPGSVAVPGTLAGLVHVHRRLGRLPIADVVAPAARLAADGVALNAYQHQIVELLRPILVLTPEGRQRWGPATAGHHMADPDLAAFIGTIPGDGVERFYRGDLAEAMVAGIRHGLGILTTADLASYRVIEREPLSTTYRGRRVLTNPPPAFGGTLVALGLSVLEARATDVDTMAVAETMVEVEERRARGGTTHLSVVDDDGNAAALSMSNGEGSGFVVPGTGVMLNNMMGEDDLHPVGFHADPPGTRVGSMMAPSILLGGDGEPPVVMGSGGSKRIRTALLQVISNIVDLGLPLPAAVDAPRVHWDGEHLQVEPGFPAETVEALRHRFSVNEWTARDLYFGGVHAVRGEEAHGDSRRGGHSLVL